MENFQRSSATPNIKYNFVVLFLSQLYILFIYASKYFLIDHHYKRYVRIYDLLAKGKIYWCSRRVCLWTVLAPAEIKMTMNALIFDPTILENLIMNCGI